MPYNHGSVLKIFLRYNNFSDFQVFIMNFVGVDSKFTSHPIISTTLHDIITLSFDKLNGRIPFEKVYIGTIEGYRKTNPFFFSS